ncbi:MAG TPA: hypothetical protein VFK31_04885 [Rhodanobacteraceae bacterium]|nr:hypothetical protein [Rhodanobacteraceae bacterium]
MNAADQRHLTPWLAGLCLVLVAVWLILLSGAGRGIQWAPPGAAQPLPMAQHPTRAGAAPPLKHYAEVWQRPLFTTNRQPAAVAADKGASSVSLDNLELTGVILAPGMHMALLTDRSDGHTVRVIEGEHMAHSSWLLKTLKPRSAEFVDNGQLTRLDLKVPTGAGTTTSANTPATTPAAPPRSKPAARSQPQTQRIQALKERIEQRRRQQAAHAGEH